MFFVQTLAPHTPRDLGELPAPTPHLCRAESFDQFYSENLHLTGWSGYWKIEKDLSGKLKKKGAPIEAG
jgi:hypothetical protein